MLNIVLFGAPGCGKGTQASRLREHYGINHVSTGEVIRAEIARGTELGRSMEEYIKSGRLAPDAVVTAMRRAISSTAFPARRFRPRSSTRFSAGTGWA